MRFGVVLVAVSALACENLGEGEHPEPEEVPPDTAAYSVESATGPGAPPSQKIVATNTLKEPLHVTVEYDGKTERLGTVNSQVGGEFFLQVPTGTQVVLTASTEAGVEVARDTMVLTPDRNLWRIR